jgi:hypothetical protein
MKYTDKKNVKHSVLNEVRKEYPNTLLEHYLKGMERYNKTFSTIKEYDKEIAKFGVKFLNKIYDKNGKLIENADACADLILFGTIAEVMKNDKVK